MAKMRVGLAACLLGLLLAGCSPPPPPPPRLTTTPAATAEADKTSADADKSKHSKKGGGKDQNAAEDPTQAYKSAINACRSEASTKTMGSVLAMLSRLRPGAYDANYAACMKTKGYDVSQ